MKDDLVSIIIPAYNARKTIERCLDSIISQTYKTLEIIVIDDGSKDETVEFIKDKYKEEKRIILIKQENQGPSTARNKGIEIANGNYILFVDSDDFLSENFIEAIWKDYQSNMLNGGNYNLVTSNKSKPSNRIDAKGQEMYIDIINGKIGGFICGYLFEKELLANLKFDTSIKFMEDVTFLLEYCKQVQGIHFIPNAFYNYVYNNIGLSKSKANVLRNIKHLDKSIDKVEEFLLANEITIRKGFISEKKLRLIDAELGKLENTVEVKQVLKDNELQKIIQNIKIDSSNKLFWRIYVRVILNSQFLTAMYLKVRKFLKKIKGGV